MTAVQLINEIKGQLTSHTGEVLQHIIKNALKAMSTIGMGQKLKYQYCAEFL